MAAVAFLVPTGSAALAPEIRQVVEAFVSRGGSGRVSDLVIEQTVTVYNPSQPLQRLSWQEWRVIKLPRRQRVEKLVDGQREIRLVVGDRAWVRRRDGKVHEAPPPTEEDRMHLLVPVRRGADDLLREWRALGIRDDRGHLTRVRGRPVAVIGARADDRGSPAVWLDADHGVIRFVTNEKVAGTPSLVDRTFSEHRLLVDGFHYPHRQEVFVGGRLLMLVTVGSVVANSGPPDTLFDPASLRESAAVRDPR
jgi:hypothetical protein